MFKGLQIVQFAVPFLYDERSNMKLAKNEQEVHISFMADEDTAIVYASSPTWIRKMDKLIKKSPEYYQCIRTDSISKTYIMPKNFISLRSKERTIELTQEQKERAKQRLPNQRNRS